jgi:hypothetical protein
LKPNIGKCSILCYGFSSAAGKLNLRFNSSGLTKRPSLLCASQQPAVAILITSSMWYETDDE